MSYQELNDSKDHISEQNLQEMFKHKGWLQKQSPSLLKTWQDRYFMISNNGQQLTYFEDDKAKSKVKGAIELKDIDKITQSKDQINILFSGREFKLKATKEAEALIWVKIIQTLADRLKLQNGTNSSSIKKEAGDGKKSWKTIDNDSSQIIQQERELLGRSSMNQEQQNSIIEDQNVLLDKIGWKDYIKSMNQEFIQNRLCYGFLGKRSQGKVKYFQKRWFLLVSAKPLYPTKYNDEQILDESKIPPLFEMDTLYYFSPDEDASMKESKGEIKMIDCQEVILKDMTKSKETGYTFKVNIGDRLYHLMADSELDRQKWSSAVKSSKITSKEINNPLKIKITKNIDLICAIYDSTKNLDGRREKVRQKINEDIDKLRKTSIKNQDYNTDCSLLIKYLDALTSELLQVLNCCLVKDPKRIDLIREYIDYLHEKICDIITSYWDKQYITVPSISLLQLAYWLEKYSVQMKDFCNDDRIQSGLKVLLNIYINRSIESVELVVSEIIEFERKSEPFENENEQLVTQAPVDLFKIINEGYDLAYSMCPIKETVFKIAYFARVLMRQYQEGLDEIMGEDGTNIESLIAFCNNTIFLNNYSKQFHQRLISQGGLTEEEAEKSLDLSKIQKKFVTISTTAKDMFFFHFFSKTAVCFKKSYLDVDLNEIIKEIMGPSQEPIQKLHDSFSRKIWKQLLDVLTFYYFNSFIIGCNKAKSNDLPKFKTKLKEDKEILISEFDGFIFENQLKLALQPFDDMSEFMESSSLGILEPCKTLRIYFGKPFTQRTVMTLLNIRSDMSKEDKKYTLESCTNLIEDYNKSNFFQVSDSEKLKLVGQLGVDEDEEQAINSEDALKEDQNRRPEITMDFDDDSSIPSSELNIDDSSSQKTVEVIDIVDEGFLNKKKPKEKDFFNSIMVNPMKQMVKQIEKGINLLDLAWERKYFRIRNGSVWIYVNERARESQGKIDLTKIEDIVAHPIKLLQFTIIMEGGKKHTLRSETKVLRDLWVKSIGKEINSILNAQQEKIEAIKTGEGKKAIIRDYEEIDRREKNKKKMEMKKQKLKDQQDEINKKKDEKRQSNALLKQNSMLPNIKDNHGYDLGDPEKRQSVVFSIDFSVPQPKQLSCCEKFMICLGVSKHP